MVAVYVEDNHLFNKPIFYQNDTVVNTDVSEIRLKGGNVEDSHASFVCQTAMETSRLATKIGATASWPQGVEQTLFLNPHLAGWAAGECRLNIIAEAKGVYKIAFGAIGNHMDGRHQDGV